MVTDDELVEALSRALSPEPRQPPASSVLALRRAVIEGQPARPSPAWWRRRLLAVAVMVPVALGGSMAAYAVTGAPLPEPVRAAANAVGLPVDSVALTDARGASAKIKDGLREHDHAAVNEAARRLRDRLSHLDAAERQRVEPEADVLLGEADRFNGQNSASGPAGSGDQGSAPATSTGGHDGPGGQPPATGLGGQPPATGPGGHDGSVDQGRPPSTGSVEQSGRGSQTSPPGTSPGVQEGSIQDNAATTTTVPRGPGGPSSHPSVAAPD